MLRQYARGLRFPVETAILLALAIFLPLWEAPKNLAWLAFVLAWLANRFRARDFGGRWDVWDTLILVWIGSGYAVAAFAGLHRSEWGATNDLLRYGLLLWLIRRSGYGERESRLVVGALLASALVALPHAYSRMLVTHSREWLEMNSVGQVNHTAIYLAIVLGMALSAVMAYWSVWQRAGRLLGILAVGSIAVSLIVTASRGAIGVALILVLLLAAAWRPRMKMALIAAVLVGVLASGFAWVAKIEVVRKQETQAEMDNVLSNRDRIWNAAIVAWQRYPAFGVGMDNFGQITLERIEQWRREAGKPFDAREYLPSPHGHSLVFNTLAERGLAGFAALVAVLAAWMATLVRHRPRARDPDLMWTLWGAALSAWVVSVGAGLVNTSLHHEHAILSVMLLGVWLAYLRRRSGP